MQFLSFFSTNLFVYLQKDFAMEIWKDINGYENMYQVSNYGRVKSLNRIVKSSWGTPKMLNEKIIKEIIDSLGYSRLSLSKNGKVKAHKIHRLVAEAFLEGNGVVNHIDGNKQNNNVLNLEFCTAKQNNAHAIKNNLKPARYNKLIICNETGELFNGQADLARKINVSQPMVSGYMKGKSKHLKGLTFKFA